MGWRIIIRTAALSAALAGPVAGQVADTTRQVAPDSLRITVPPDTAIVRWPLVDTQKGFPLFGISATDSSLRWELWRDAGEWLSRRHRFTYGLGGYGRSTGLVSGAAAMNRDLVRWHGAPLNNATTGQVDWATVPLDRARLFLAPLAQGASSVLVPTEFYVVKPMSRFDYEQSSYDYRVLDGALALPVSRRTQFQASYQGQKDGGRYDRAAFEGRRATVDVRHLLPSGALLGAFALYQGAEAEESLGYGVGDPAAFSFNRFRAEPLSRNSVSRRRHLLTGIRLQAGGAGAADGLVVYRDLHRRDWRAVDTVGQRVSAWGLGASHTWNWGPLTVRPEADLRHESPAGGGLLWAKPRWRARAGASAQAELLPWLAVGGHAAAEAFDAQAGALLSGFGTLALPAGAELRVSLAHETTPQPWAVRYATGHGFTGSRDIPEYRAERAEVRLRRVTGLWRPEASVEWVSDQNAPALSGDSAFVGSARSAAWATWAGLLYESERWEGRASAGLQQWDAAGGDIQALQRLEAFWKGPVIRSAAYLKAGAVAVLSPLPYRSPLWLGEYGLWVRDPSAAEVPAWFRLDLEFSARVRSLIVLGRLENALDGLGQRGYFETLPYPMPARRFRLGVKVVFRE